MTWIWYSDNLKLCYPKNMATKIFSSMKEVTDDVHRHFIKAGISTVNIVAASARNNAKREIENKFTLRNNFTTNQLRFTPCGNSVQSLSQIKSETGIMEKAGYMARQEQGGTHRNKNGGNLVIPTTKARGGSNEKKVRRSYYYSAIKDRVIRGSTNFSSHKAALVARAFVAAKIQGFIRMNNSIFKVSSFRKAGKNISFKSTHILNLKHQSTHTPKKEWLEPASERAAQMMQDVFNQQMDKLK